MVYYVTFARYGFAEIEATSEQEAYEIAEGYGADNVSWSDDFDAMDTQPSED